MSSPNEPLRLDENDLFGPRVDAYLEEQQMLRRDIPEVPPPPLLIRIIYSSYFYLSLAGAIGAFCAWAIIEPFLTKNGVENIRESNILAWMLLFPTVTGFTGLFLGAVEGIMCRNPARAAISALVGLAIGFAGGLGAIFIGGFIMGIMVQVAVAIGGKPAPGQMPQGMTLLFFMMARGLFWAIAAIPAGLGQGIALRDKKVILNGLLGAVLGGLLGGMLFDPIYLIFTKGATTATLSRGVGFTVIGILVGLFIGLVEQWTKTAWLLMKAGPLAGKQFILYRNPTVLGSSPKADVYLFKDEAIEPRHALIHNRGGRFEIEDCGTPDGTYVNGIPVRRQYLQSGDQIVLGKTVLEFTLKESQ
jgi:hypothetical protein